MLGTPVKTSFKQSYLISLHFIWEVQLLIMFISLHIIAKNAPSPLFCVSKCSSGLNIVSLFLGNPQLSTPQAPHCGDGWWQRMEKVWGILSMTFLWNSVFKETSIYSFEDHFILTGFRVSSDVKVYSRLTSSECMLSDIVATIILSTQTEMCYKCKRYNGFQRLKTKKDEKHLTNNFYTDFML